MNNSIKAEEALARAKQVSADHKAKRANAEDVVALVRAKFPHELNTQLAYVAVLVEQHPLDRAECIRAISLLTAGQQESLRALFA